LAASGWFYDDWLEEKVKLVAYIPRWLKLALISYIQEKYGGDVPYGAKSEAVTELLAWALETHAPTRLDDGNRARDYRYQEECERILAILKTFIVPGIQPGSRISYILLAKAITMARGRRKRKGPFGTKADRRTIKRWIKRMEKLGYITETETSTYAIPWVPDEERCRKLLAASSISEVMKREFSEL